MRRRRILAARPGQALVETALTISAYFLVVLGLMEGGLVVWTFGTLLFSVHDGARFAVLASTPDASAVRSRVASTASEMGIALAPADVTVAVNGTATDAAYTVRLTGDRLRVTADYSYQPATPWIYSVAVPISARIEMAVE